MNILISAGPMRTYIDPIRYIQNSSSGVLGLEIALALKQKLPLVNIVTILGPVDSKVNESFRSCSTVYEFQTTKDYERLLKYEFPNCDLFISSAAVLDFEVDSQQEKISRADLEQSSEIKFKKNNVPDFVGWMGNEFKKPSQKVFAFSLDTRNEPDAIKRAKDKVQSKKLDGIFVNFAGPREGPEKPMSSGVILNKSGDIAKRVALSDKRVVADVITSYLISHLDIPKGDTI
jgi:phosphopantothenoylcysteine decarboxylase / phosphopantothenate---cysteine ligase